MLHSNRCSWHISHWQVIADSIGVRHLLQGITAEMEDGMLEKAPPCTHMESLNILICLRRNVVGGVVLMHLQLQSPAEWKHQDWRRHVIPESHPIISNPNQDSYNLSRFQPELNMTLWSFCPLPEVAQGHGMGGTPLKKQCVVTQQSGNNLNNGMDHEKYGWHGMLPSYQEIKGYDQSIFSLSVHIFNNTIQTASNGLVGRCVVPIFHHHFAIHHFLSFSHLIFTHHFTYHTSSPLPTSFQTWFHQI